MKEITKGGRNLKLFVENRPVSALKWAEFDENRQIPPMYTWLSGCIWKIWCFAFRIGNIRAKIVALTLNYYFDIWR